MKSYGINRSTAIESDFDFHVEEFRYLGYSVIENVLPESELSTLRSELDKIYTEQAKKFGEENLNKINEKNLARALLCYSEEYLNLAQNEAMMKYVKQALGDYFLLHLQNGVINMPNEEHHQSSWHRDLPYQNWTSSEPIGCNVFYCLDDFNEETGGTFLLPFSHKIERAPSQKYFEKNSVQPKAKAGSAIIFDSMLFHKAGFNSSKNQIRRGINHLYAKSVIRQQINLPEILQGKYADNPFLNMLLGYDAQTAVSVEEYRNRRLNKNKNLY